MVFNAPLDNEPCVFLVWVPGDEEVVPCVGAVDDMKRHRVTFLGWCLHGALDAFLCPQNEVALGDEVKDVVFIDRFPGRPRDRLRKALPHRLPFSTNLSLVCMSLSASSSSRSVLV